MSAEIIRPGISVPYSPASEKDLGDIVVQGELVGVVGADAEAGSSVKLWLTGTYNVVKATGTGTAIPVGSLIYWDATNKFAVTNNGGGVNKLMGKATRDAGDDDRFVRVLLTP